MFSPSCAGIQDSLGKYVQIHAIAAQTVVLTEACTYEDCTHVAHRRAVTGERVLVLYAPVLSGAVSRVALGQDGGTLSVRILNFV